MAAAVIVSELGVIVQRSDKDNGRTLLIGQEYSTRWPQRFHERKSHDICTMVSVFYHYVCLSHNEWIVRSSDILEVVTMGCGTSKLQKAQVSSASQLFTIVMSDSINQPCIADALCKFTYNEICIFIWNYYLLTWKYEHGILGLSRNDVTA